MKKTKGTMGKKRVILFGVAAFILFVQLGWRIVPEEKIFQPLGGVEVAKAWPTISWSSWKSGEYQKAVEEWVQARLPFKPVWVRSYNEVNWKLFSRISARPYNPLVPGVEGTLFERQYLNHWLKGDSVGAGFKQRLKTIVELRDSLSERGIFLVLLPGPSKPHVYPWLTGRDEWRNIGTRNPHRIYVEETCRKNALLCLNTTSWFHKMAFEGDQHLFPKGGTHWSYYGAWLAVDSLTKMINPLLKPMGVEMAEMNLISKQKGPPRQTDKDLAELANLWMIGSVSEAIPYPIWSPKNGGVRPRFLLIGDSFLWTLLTHLQKHKSHQEIDFLYYNKRLFEYPENTNQICADMTEKCNPWGLAKNKHVVLLEANEIVLPELGWGAVEAMLKGIKTESK